jgi:hypothetical protein
MEIDYHRMTPLITDNPDSRPFIDYKAGDDGGSGATILDIPANEFPTGYAISPHNGYLTPSKKITITETGPTVRGTSENIAEGEVVQIKSGGTNVGNAVISTDGTWSIASSAGRPAHGRSNEQASLNPVTKLDVLSYSPTYVEILFTQPVVQAGYSWEVWINGSVEATISKRGNYSLNVAPNSTIQVAVASIKNGGDQYSVPMTASITTASGKVTVVGASGDWVNVGQIEYDVDDSIATIKLGSLPYLSDENQAYDDLIVNDPVMQDSLTNFTGAGDVDVVNPDTEIDWTRYNYRGYRCKWRYGDEDWPISQFRQVLTTLIDGCRSMGGRVYRFDLMDSGHELNRTFTDVDVVKEISAKSTIKWILEQAGLRPVVFINVDQQLRDLFIKIEIKADTTINQALKKITDSIGAYARYNQLGDVEVFIPDGTGDPDVTLTEDDIAYDGVRQIETIPAYRIVTIKMADGRKVTGRTTALTGNLSEEIVIDTLLFRDVDANVMLDHYVAYYSRTHSRWEIKIFDQEHLIQVGECIGIEHSEVRGKGIVTDMTRSPLSPYGTIEVEV